MVTNAAGETAPLTVLDPDVPFLAARAAIELDNLRLGRSIGFGAVHDLAARLRRSSAPAEEQELCGRLTSWDPPTVSAMSEAICAWTSQRPRSLEALVQEAWSLAQSLQSTNSDDELLGLEKATHFCRILSERATAYQQSMYEPEVETPFEE